MTIILKNIRESGKISFEEPGGGYAQKLRELLAKAWDKNNGFLSLTLELPKRPRTIGAGSQNNLIWKLISLIASEVGDDSPGFEDTERGVKLRALSRGYPFRVNRLTGAREPLSMTKIDTEQAKALIDTLIEICAELGIQLPPNI